MSLYANVITRSGAGALPPELDPKGDGLVYGAAAARFWGNLDRLATELGLAPLSTFLVHEQMDANRSDAPSRSHWYDPAEGLKTVSGMLNHLKKPPEADLGQRLGSLTIQDDLRWLVWDLTAFELVLLQASSSSDEFGIVVC